LPEIASLGAQLIAISPQLPEHSRELIERRHLTFPILSDRGNEVAARFGLRFAMPDYLRALYGTFPLDLEKFNGEPSWTLPIPARLIVDGDGIIRAVDADADYTRRPEPEKTLADLKAIL